MRTAWRAAVLVAAGLLWRVGNPPLVAQGQGRLTLEEAVRRALEVSPSLEAGRGTVAVAAGARREVEAERLPEAGIGGVLWRYEEPMIYRPIHEFSAENFPGFDRTLIQGEFQVGWTVFDGWIRSRRVDQARAQEAAAGGQLTSREQSVIAATAQAYVEVLTAGEIVSAQERRRSALAAERTRVERFLAEGRAARVELLRVSAALSAAEADRSVALARLDVAEAALSRLTGLPPDAARFRALVGVRPGDLAAAGRDSLLAEARRANPSLRAAASRVEAAEAAHRAARGAWYPTLRLEGRLITYGAAEQKATTEWQTGVRLYYPLYSLGGRSASVQRTEAMVGEATGAHRELDQAIAGQLDDALARLTEARAQAAALRAAVDQWEEVVRTEALALREGAGTQTDYIRAEADLATGRAELARAVGLQILAAVRLAQVTGGLTPATLATLVETTP